MYNVDDAVARVDSYIVSVTGAASLVGDRRLVRIDSVGRAAATASLVGGPEPPSNGGSAGDGGEADGDSDGDPVESGPSRRRRGRRGGRRRSRARAQNPSNGE
jgi:ribonuclease G